MRQRRPRCAVSSAFNGGLTRFRAGVQITPQTVRVLQQWGLGETLGSTAAEPIALTITRYDGSKVLGETPDWRGWMIENFGAPVWECVLLPIRPTGVA